ncbi:hypothetical protein G6F68_012801 [Rhizopus microsporus]|nr:hypothetical protein G6F68_012801 [Rhizopus microsporus]
MFVGGGDHFGIAHRTARLDHRLDASGSGGVDAVAEREERVGGHHRALDHQVRIGGLDAGDARRVHTAHLAGTHADRAVVPGIDDRVGLHELGHLPGEQQVGELLVGRRQFADHLQFVTGHAAVVRGLQQQARADALAVEVVQAIAVRDAQHAHVGLLLRVFQRGRLVVRGNQHFDELAVQDHLGGGGVQRFVEGDDAAEGAGRVGGVGQLVGIAVAGTDGHAARVGVLDDDAGRRLSSLPCSCWNVASVPGTGYRSR